MASCPESDKEQEEFNSPKIKVSGNLGALHVINNSDSDSDENNDNNITIRATPKPQSVEDFVNAVPGLIQPSATIAPSSTYNFSQSENIQIGDNTFFHGPVTINQIIKTKGIDNASYTPTDNEYQASDSFPPKPKYEEASQKASQDRPWLKVILSLASVGVLGIICTVAFLVQSHNQSDIIQANTEPASSVKETNYTKVVGICYDNLQIIVFTIIVVPITIFLMLCSLLTSKTLDGTKKVRKNCVIEQSLIDYPQGDFNSSTEKIKIKDDPLLISPTHLRIVSRTDWLAQPVESELDKIKQPVPWVVITHTATEGCYYQSQCVLRVRLIQMFHIESKQWDDIGYNFLVAGDGSAYFGRGWDYIGAHTLGYNRYSIGIAFVGTFNSETPPQKQIEACQKLIKLGVQLGKIRKDYKLFAHRQLSSTLSPGDKVYDIIKEWPHFVKDVNNLEELTPKDY